MRYFVLPLVLCCASWLISQPAHARCVTNPNSLAPVFYVSPTGSDSNSCTSLSAPCLTIQAAIQKAVASAGSNGARIVLRGGRYYDSSVSIDGYSGSSGRRLMIEAYSTEVPQLNDLASPLSVTNSSYVYVCDVQLRYAANTGVYFGSSTHVSLENVLVYYSGSYGIYWSNVTFSDMIGVRSSWSAAGKHGINLVDSSYNSLVDITATVNRRSGLNMSGGQYNYVDRITASYNFDPLGYGENADGISISAGGTSGGHHTILNCTVAHNDDDGIDVWTSTENYIEDCVSSSNGASRNGTGANNPYRDGLPNTAGDGNGYKLGSGGYNTVADSLAQNNSAYGFAKNSGPGNACRNDRAIGNNYGATSFPTGESCKTNVQTQ